MSLPGRDSVHSSRAARCYGHYLCGASSAKLMGARAWLSFGGGIQKELAHGVGKRHTMSGSVGDGGCHKSDSF